MNKPTDKPGKPQSTPVELTAENPHRDPVEELAAEFVERRRDGDRITIDDFARAHPDFAEEIQELFPAIVAMERLNRRVQHDSRPLVSKQEINIEQLGDFRVIGEIARGGMGIVYEAEQVSLGRRVAVKVLPKQALRGEKDVQRFHREAQTSSKLHHTNIVPVFGVGEQDGMHYIVMQCIQGVGLDEIISELKRLMLGSTGTSSQQADFDDARSSYVKRNAAALLNEKLRQDSLTSVDGDTDSAVAQSLLSTSRVTDGVPSAEYNRLKTSDPPQTFSPITARINADYWKNVALIGVQVSNALQYAHTHQTLHRDVKPGNLLLDGEGVVWVADFGLAKAVEQDDVTWTGDIVGTLSYMAPERFHGDCDERSDIYGLGLTLYELLTFERAFEGRDRVALMHRVAHEILPSPRRRNPGIPRDLETIVMKAAARDPIDRYQSAGDLATDLQCFIDDRPIKARRVNVAEQLLRWCRRNRAVASLTATVAALLVIVSIITTSGYLRESAQRYRAESSERMALEALDKIYSQFAPGPLQLPASQTTEADTRDLIGDDSENEEALMAVQTQLPLSKDVAKLLDNLLLFYDQLSSQAGNDQNVLFKTIKAHRRVADIKSRLGDFEDAKARYQRAITRSQGFKKNTQETAIELARVHNGLGSVLVATRDQKQAVKAHEQALDLLNNQATFPESKYELARTLYLLHESQQRPWWQRKRNDDTNQLTMQPLEEAIDLLDGLLINQPDVSEYRFLMAKCYRAVAEAKQNDVSDADGQTIQQLESLVQRYPDIPDYRYELADAYAVTDSRSLRWNRDYSPRRLSLANQRLERALEVSSNIDASHPNILQYVTLANRLHYTMAIVKHAQNEKEQARQHLDAAIARQERILQAQPDSYSKKMWLANLKVDLAQLWSELDRPDAARNELARIPDILGPPGSEKDQTDSEFIKRFTRRIRTRANELANSLP
ncbi:MAG: serine/threonine protein kinase [Planctomycetaceae bacterium]|nr:serine/threonine protein kinase [Planctomycetaceae bacterium]